MARQARKSIYEKIESQKAEILNKEKELAELNKGLQELFEERDREEMERLLAQVRANGLDIELALQKLSGQSVQDNTQDNTQEEIKQRRKRTNKSEENEQISLVTDDTIE